LVVEDDPTDAALVASYLKADAGLECVVADSLVDAREHLLSADFDLIVVDLGLPDSSPEQTFAAMRDTAPAVPIVVLTGTDDEDVAIRTIGEGAQDYLTKHDLSDNLLLRSIRYSLERHVAGQRRVTERIRELQIFETLAPESLDHADRSIAELHPEVFDGGVRAYGNLLDLAVTTDYSGMEDDVRAQSRAIAFLLGQLGASPRDLAAVHATVLGERQAELDSMEFRLYEDVARLLLLRITGELANYYLEQILSRPDTASSPESPATTATPAAPPAEAKASPPRPAKEAVAPAKKPAKKVAAKKVAKAPGQKAPAPKAAEPEPAPKRVAAAVPEPEERFSKPAPKAPAAFTPPPLPKVKPAASTTVAAAALHQDPKPLVFDPATLEPEPEVEPTAEAPAKANRLTAADYSAWAERMKQKRDELKSETAPPEEAAPAPSDEWSADALFDYTE
jgi:DNA-binding NarL/FixJ family response regulator